MHRVPTVLFALPDRSEEPSAAFQIEVKGEVRRYKGCIDVWVSGKSVQLVNEVDLEDYVAGVLESEGGHVPSFQYFKARPFSPAHSH